MHAFVRADLAELLAVGELPFALWSFRRLAAEPSVGRVAAASVLYAVLILSHNLTAFSFSAVLATFCLVLVLSMRNWRVASYLAAAIVLGLALSAFLWLPALGEHT